MYLLRGRFYLFFYRLAFDSPATGYHQITSSTISAAQWGCEWSCSAWAAHKFRVNSTYPNFSLTWAENLRLSKFPEISNSYG